MATRVPDLPVLLAAAGDESIVVLQPNNNLATIATGRFRPATWYTGQGVGIPSNVFTVAASAHPSVHGPFKEGDMYLRFNGSDVSYWRWDVTTGNWAQISIVANASTLNSFSSTIDYDMNTALVVDIVNFKDGDFYHNLSNNRIYGPYASGTGIDFDPDTCNVYHLDAHDETTSVELAAWNPWDTATKTDDWYMPQHLDTYFQKLADSDHGGYVWVFNKALFDADPGNILSQREAGWGTRVNARGPKQFSKATAPTSFDDLKFIAGDTVLARDTQAIWGPYSEGKEDTATAWGDDPLFTRPNVLLTEDTDLRNYLPPIDNSAYDTDDLLLWRQTLGAVPLTLLFIYDSTLNTGLGAWAEQQTLRGNVTFVVTQGNGVWEDTSNANDAYYDVEGAPIEGDIIRRIHTFPSGHDYGITGEPSGRVEHWRITDVDRTTGDITFSVMANTTAHIHDNPLLGPLAFDDNTFSAGDFMYDLGGTLFGPYSEGETTDELAWTKKVIRSTGIYSEIVDTIDYAPTVDNLIYENGDTLVHTINVGTIPLVRTFGPYDRAGNSGTGEWPFLSSMRAPRVYELTQLDGLVAPEHLNITDDKYVVEGQPVVGDSVVIKSTFETGNPNDKTVGDLTGKVISKEVIGVDTTTGIITFAAGVDMCVSRIQHNSIAGRLLIDDNWCCAGDMLMDSVAATFGPYKMGQTDITIAWPINSLAPANQDVTVVRDDGNATFVLHIDDNNVMYHEEI